eukprot:CAMPEP_0173401824 /NCGR_PEP_ID=MMETSP1356-20130122/52126_1 /TAXON_ID=77927 ORGANISM="Hemiselmis virescens, Strain PCC157" /NCGR_SAMPLE_ID=MMETSP1356 /ASSEMBLY_ACC=CAM_ASM_000847 /LENGTH=43 /DNA_ID= /DNA_START= /DNA_END= /DNA_ORIENTATION=
MSVGFVEAQLPCGVERVDFELVIVVCAAVRVEEDLKVIVLEYY